MKTPKRKRPTRAKAAGPKRRRDWEIVPVKQGPLRSKTASECSRELAKVERARATWRRFEREDKPAYERWVAASFGGQMTRLRDGAATLRERERLIEEVEVESARTGRSRRTAFATVQRRKAMPPRSPRADDEPPPEEDEPAGFARDEDAEEAIPQDEQRDMFENFLRMFLGREPADLSQREYEKMFAEFQEDVFASTAPESAPPPPETAAEPRPENVRLKETYRLLVRRLHPDLRADSDAEVSAIWHDVQEAYGLGNLERLEMLLALTDIQSKSTGAHTSLFQMREVLAELRRAYQSLQKSLRIARKDPAWNFARVADRTTLHVRLERQFQSELAWQQKRLREHETLIARWSQRPKSRAHAVSDLQAEFSF